MWACRVVIAPLFSASALHHASCPCVQHGGKPKSPATATADAATRLCSHDDSKCVDICNVKGRSKILDQLQTDEMAVNGTKAVRWHPAPCPCPRPSSRRLHLKRAQRGRHSSPLEPTSAASGQGDRQRHEQSAAMPLAQGTQLRQLRVHAVDGYLHSSTYQLQCTNASSMAAAATGSKLTAARSLDAARSTIAWGAAGSG